MCEVTEKIFQEELDWVHRRLEALDKIEAKLLEMRELATYAASRTLTARESAKVQEWVDILQAEVKAIDQATALRSPVFNNLSICQMEAKKSIQ